MFPAGTAILLLLCLLAAPARALDEWGDELDDLSSAPVHTPQSQLAVDQAIKAEPKVNTGSIKGFRLRPQDHYLLEAAAVFVLSAFIVNFWFGKRYNQRIALAFSGQFCRQDGVLARNFALVGTGHGSNKQIWLRQTPSLYYMWASGRRYCTGMLASLNLRFRHDLYSWATHLVDPYSDTVLVEVHMAAGHMPQTVLAVGQPAYLDALPNMYADVKAFTKPHTVDKAMLRDWPAGQLAVRAESATVFYSLFTRQVMDSVLGSQVRQKATHGLMRWLHFTSEFKDEAGNQKQMLRFCFNLPPRGQMHKLQRLMDMVMAFIDIVGAYEMPPKVLEAATQLREDVRNNKQDKKENAARAAAQKRKDAEQERVRRMTPQDREKYEERKKKIEYNRLLKKRTKKG